jgi:S-adenosylmethionine-diacylgycerolhomoserine-N-methlytransferase
MPADLSADSHVGLMDKVYRRQRYVYDFTRKYYLFGRDALIRDLALQPGQRVVEIGCGTARNLIAIGRRWPGVKLYGLDASGEMLKTAKANLTRAGLGDAVLIQGLAENLSPAAFGGEAFDHAIFSYSLSMIPDWRAALFAAANALSAEGLIHIVDFGDLKTLPGRGILRAWLKLFHVTPREVLLQALEEGFSQPGKGLTILPGRYAFCLTMPKGKVGPIGCGTAVTGRE